MTDFDSLREDIAGIFDSVVRHSEAQNRLHDAVLVQVDRLWQDNAELRDELHALANRVESLTRAVAIRDGSDFTRRGNDFSAVEESRWKK